MEEKKVSIQKSIIWNSAGSMVYLITQWLISVLVVRLSGVETAGVLTLAMSVNNVFYSIAMQGIRNYQVSDMKEKYTSGIYVSSRLIICILSLPTACLRWRRRSTMSMPESVRKNGGWTGSENPGW